MGLTTGQALQKEVVGDITTGYAATSQIAHFEDLLY
jgi:hypothetical protein